MPEVISYYFESILNVLTNSYLQWLEKQELLCFYTQIQFLIQLLLDFCEYHITLNLIPSRYSNLPRQQEILSSINHNTNGSHRSFHFYGSSLIRQTFLQLKWQAKVVYCILKISLYASTRSKLSFILLSIFSFVWYAVSPWN